MPAIKPPAPLPTSMAEALERPMLSEDQANLLRIWRHLMAANSNCEAHNRAWVSGAIDKRRFSNHLAHRGIRNAWEGLVIGFWAGRENA